MPVMTRYGALVRSVFGVSRSVVLFFLLAGFIAMHGVASTSETGVHHSGITLASTATDHATVAMPGPGADVHGEPGTGTPGTEVGTDGTGGGDGGSSHGLMVGCLIVLCGIVAAVALRLSRRGRTDFRFRVPSWAGFVAPGPDRPPPRRYLISLCVLRV